MSTAGNAHVGRGYDSTTVTGVDTDGSGQFTVSFTALRTISGPEDVDASTTGGYVVNCVSVSGNTATFEVRQGHGGTAASELPLVTGGAGVTDVHASATGS